MVLFAYIMERDAVPSLTRSFKNLTLILVPIIAEIRYPFMLVTDILPCFALQVYHHFGNATVGPPDAYSEVRCTVCNSERDECLLLLCDLCDSAAHTYCVGLGATVPEGDWFCQDCTVSRAEHENSETDRDSDGRTSFGSFHEGQPAEGQDSIIDIVREFGFREVRRPFTTVMQLPNHLSSPILPERTTNLADSMTERPSGTNSSIAPTESNARTVRHCRYLILPAIQTRDLAAAPLLLTDHVNHTLHVASSQHVAAQKGSSCDTRSSYDVDKAWKMMDVAKSMGARKGTSLTDQTSKHPTSKLNTPMGKARASSSLLSSSNKPFGNKDLADAGPQKHYQHYSLEKGNDSHIAQSPGYHELPSSRKVQTSAIVDIYHGNVGKVREENLPAVSSDVSYEHGRSACLISSARPMTAASNTDYAKLDVYSSSNTLSSEKAGMGKSCAGSNSKKDDDAKSEIQSLVKLNLKLLTCNKMLGVDAFKQIARLATHSILAACGLEHPKPGVRSFPSFVCCHANQAQQLQIYFRSPCFWANVTRAVLLPSPDLAA
ncbi:RING/U-box protein [Actinidia rufa]|uniref:RING/U-box protein n=1 Tax=Actinidia rufa TaxID=165716 RepID=A0A7J0GA57_9ERIC|nr:RING/U-box protein [Actinidia rufa]